MPRRWLILLLVLLAPAVTSAAAQAGDALQPADSAAIRQVIQGQMDAFRADDWAAAFAFAAPGIQSKFVSPDIFRQMVTDAYQPVYRPKGVEFRALEPSEFGPTQEVFVIGPDGLAYLAYYTMERQADGTWRINGCYLVRAPDESV